MNYGDYISQNAVNVSGEVAEKLNTRDTFTRL